MKNLTNFLQFGSCISLIMLMTLFMLPQSSHAQIDELPDGTEVLNLVGFETDKYVLTDSMKTALEKLVDVDGTAGYMAECKSGKSIKLIGYSDYQQYRNVSKEVSDRLNDLLARQRIQSVARYAIDELGMSEHCFMDSDAIYADSKVRGVGFAVIEPAGGSFLYRKLARRVDSTAAGILSQLEEEINDLKEQIDENSDRLDDHYDRITENRDINRHQDSLLYDINNRVTVLESQVKRGVSTYISLASISFAGETTPAFEAGTRHGDVRLSGWFGYWKDYTANLDEGLRDFDRMLAGASVTWYALNTRYVDAGPSIGAQWTHDEIEQEKKGADCRFIYYSALIGADLTAKIGPVDLFGNVSWSPTKEIVRGDIHRNTNPLYIKVGLRVNFN